MALILNTVWIVVVSTATLAFWSISWQNPDELDEVFLVDDCAQAVATQTGKKVRYTAGHAQGLELLWGTGQVSYDIAGNVIWTDGSISRVTCLGEKNEFYHVQDIPK